jgi:serine/threonine-protein kinase
VYRAEHPQQGQVAFKVLIPRLANDPVAVKRFLREAEFGERLNHPNIVRTYSYGAADGLQYLALEWAEGEPLASFLTRSGPLAPPVVANIVEQIGAALTVAHRAGIIHRDLKPANIMIDGQGQVVIMDFGLAGVAEQMVGAEIGAGTPAYMAPEQLAGREVSLKSDIYALGLVLYEMFTGRPPSPTTCSRSAFHSRARIQGSCFSNYYRRTRCHSIRLAGDFDSRPRSRKPSCGASSATGPSAARP